MDTQTTVLLVAQGGYAAAGAAYNIVSLHARRTGHTPPHQGPAAAGLATMCAYIAGLLLGVAGLESAYRLTMLVLLVAIAHGGVVAHLRRGPTDHYRSRATWATAITINTIGVLLTTVGVVGGL